MSSQPRSNEMSAGEAVFGLVAWLASLEKPLRIGKDEENEVLATIATRFCHTHGIDLPDEDQWMNKLRARPEKVWHPSSTKKSSKPSPQD